MDSEKYAGSDDAVVADWASRLPDPQRAEVVKAHDAQHEETHRLGIREHEETERKLHETDGYHVVRGLFVAFLLALVGGATCVGYHALELRRAQVDLAREQLAAASRPPGPVTIVAPDAGAPSR